MEQSVMTQQEINRLSQTPKKRSFASKIGLPLIIMTLPTVIYIFIFSYLPLSGLIIAFKDYNAFQGMFNSPWTSMSGFQHFYDFIHASNFWTIIVNTLKLSLLSIIFNTICPIILALIVNEIPYKRYKRVVQTIMYAPYFLSITILVGMLFVFFDVDSGIFTRILVKLGMEPQNLMENPDAFSAIYVISGLWQGLGWWSIVYMGTLSNVDPNLHDAAIIDGAGKLRRIFTVNFPAILPMAVIMFIMSIGNILTVGFEKVYLMQTARNLISSQTISTYVYAISFPTYGQAQFSYATAIGLFNSIINLFILCMANFVSRKVSEYSLW